MTTRFLHSYYMKHVNKTRSSHVFSFLEFAADKLSKLNNQSRGFGKTYYH